VSRTPLVPELDCVDVREALVSGRPLSAAEAEHAAACPVCSQALPQAGAGEAALFAAVEAAVQEERGLAAWLRNLPTMVRIFVGFDVAIALVTMMTLARPRWAYGPVPMERVTFAVSVLALLYVFVLRQALRPLQAPPANRRLVTAVFAAGLAVPLLFALFPPAGPGDSALAAMRTAVSCFWFGAAPGALLVVALRLLDRGAHAVGDVALLAAVGGGLVGNAALELHCPSTAPLHLVLGHATVGVALVAFYAMRTRARVID
jgi:hypothetical protein